MSVNCGRDAAGMRYALISDIHANLPALDACLDAIDAMGVDATYHLGDLVGYAPWPNEVVDRLREREIAGISGNYDSTVATRYKHCGCRYEDPRQEELSHVSYAWTLEHVSEDSREFLGALPFRLDVRPLGAHVAGPTIILVHGTPLNNVTYWTEDRPDSFCTKMAEAAGARPGDLIAFGHTHTPWHRVVDGVHFANTGSVGRPKDGDPRAGFVSVDVDAARTITLSFERVAYDVQRTANAIRASELPDEFASYIETGGAVTAAR
ncbi:MAG TPA: metallophosphoesterase family protein [Gemmatimonadaceae bacterium]|nr:metallophosphoesterase family protein [Gemmatimonadaceae bacterium]